MFDTDVLRIYNRTHWGRQAFNLPTIEDEKVNQYSPISCVPVDCKTFSPCPVVVKATNRVDGNVDISF